METVLRCKCSGVVASFNGDRLRWVTHRDWRTRSGPRARGDRFEVTLSSEEGAHLLARLHTNEYPAGQCPRCPEQYELADIVNAARSGHRRAARNVKLRVSVEDSLGLL